MNSPAIKLIAGLALLACASARAEGFSEYEVKATFLCKLPEFVKWPASEGVSGGAPIVIGVLGDDPFKSALEGVARNLPADSRRVSFQRSRRAEDLRGCQIVFVCRSEKNRIGEIVDTLAGTGALIVGDSDGFARQGGMIGLVLSAQGSVGFEVNRGAASRAGIVISSRLLKLARLVGN